MSTHTATEWPDPCQDCGAPNMEATCKACAGFGTESDADELCQDCGGPGYFSRCSCQHPQEPPV